MSNDLKKLKKDIKKIEKKIDNLSLDVDFSDNYLDRRITKNLIWVIVIIAISIVVHICI